MLRRAFVHQRSTTRIIIGRPPFSGLDLTRPPQIVSVASTFTSRERRYYTETASCGEHGGRWWSGQRSTFAAFCVAGGAAALGSLGAIIAVEQNNKTVSCDSATGSTLPSNKDSTEQLASSATSEDEDDPYGNLPEEDEETDCSMCKTFRKGPCRPYWRPLERCFKDNDGKEGGVAQHCMRYFRPHQECLMQYTNLYQLVSLEMKQELVQDASLSVSPEERRSWNPKVDWSIWKEFTAEVGGTFRETVISRDEHNGDLLPLWKRFPEKTEPVLVTIATTLPQVDPESGMILKLAFAIDQDGMALGMDYNKEYGKLVEKAQAAVEKKEAVSEQDSRQPQATSSSSSPKEAEDDSGSDDESNKGPPQFEFFVLPGETRSVQICGLYSENPVTADPEKKILDALLFRSPHHNLKDLASEKPKV